jgi:hypothetical protein
MLRVLVTPGVFENPGFETTPDPGDAVVPVEIESAGQVEFLTDACEDVFGAEQFFGFTQAGAVGDLENRAAEVAARAEVKLERPGEKQNQRQDQQAEAHGPFPTAEDTRGEEASVKVRCFHFWQRVPLGIGIQGGKSR